MGQQNYTFSFTSIAAAVSESTMVAQLYIASNDWKEVKAQVLDNNLLQARTSSYAGRLYRELYSRLRVLQDKELQLLIDGNEMEQRQLLWIAICRRYPPVSDFAKEVLVDQYEQGKQQLWVGKFEHFYSRKLEWYPELEQLSGSTIKKAGSVLFRMLKECGLMSQDRDNRIIKQRLSPLMLDTIEYDQAKMALFPGGLE
uniref:DUF1819 domain-containing protein n=1 Tax=uncultured Thiotrichaceae bacterium TaxID=298394 RepID=A0A6S6UJ57_9GAMM|nr:MAG: Unknown protein [uncultured Thiotrichaceae bacterium]